MWDVRTVLSIRSSAIGRTAAILVIAAAGAVLPVDAQEEQDDVAIAKLGILLDTSAEMGFLVPQVRKEVRLLNQRLVEMGRPTVVLHESIGASIDREASLSVPGSRNALYPIKALFGEDEVDTVYWITALQGLQSGGGLFAIERLLSESVEGRPARQLVIRNIWQDQLQAGDSWLRNPPAAEVDPLDPATRPEQWYRLVAEKRGVIVRSWQSPPAEFREQFGFPWRVRHSGYLRKEGYTAPVEFDVSWSSQLRQRHQLRFHGPKEEWPTRITGRSWILDHSLVPCLDEGEEEWSEEVFLSLSIRDSMEEDLDRIEADRVGVLFAFGYIQSDLDRFRTGVERSRGHPFYLYMKDISGFVDEFRDNRNSWVESGEEGKRFYATEFLEVDRAARSREDTTDPIALRIAQMVREANLDAVYLFTNGYLGGGAYGSFTIDLEWIERAIREAGIRLYVRMPFETGPAPVALQRLALASGGRVFLGKEGDPDWEMEALNPKWVTPAEEEE